MHEGRRVNEFHDAGVKHIVRALVTKHLCHEKKKGGPEPLPASRKDVLANVLERSDPRLEVASQFLLDEFQPGCDKLEESFGPKGELLVESPDA